MRRPTHFNNSYDLARFEACAQRWFDLAEPGFGLALLNDCKYGYSVHGGVMSLSLLRAPKYPDPAADIGSHRFRYALLPHCGSLQDAGVAQEAQRFNSPLALRNTEAERGDRSWFGAEPANVVIDTVKKAEGSEALVVRLYEAGGTRSHVCLRSMLPVQSASKCNLLEKEEEALEWHDGGARFRDDSFSDCHGQAVFAAMTVHVENLRIKRMDLETGGIMLKKAISVGVAAILTTSLWADFQEAVKRG